MAFNRFGEEAQITFPDAQTSKASTLPSNNAPANATHKVLAAVILFPIFMFFLFELVHYRLSPLFIFFGGL